MAFGEPIQCLVPSGWLYLSPCIGAVSTLCRFYNASGDPIRVDIAHSWTGRFYRGEPPAIVENGQWTAFLHVHPTGTKKGSVGAVIYRTIEDTDIFFGWQNPWRAMHGTRYTEKDYWWGSESNILPLAEDKGCRKDQSIQRGYKASLFVRSQCSYSSTHVDVIVFCIVCRRAQWGYNLALHWDHREGLIEGDRKRVRVGGMCIE